MKNKKINAGPPHQIVWPNQKCFMNEERKVQVLQQYASRPLKDVADILGVSVGRTHDMYKKRGIVRTFDRKKSKRIN